MRRGGDALGGVGKAGARRWRERPWSPPLLSTLFPPSTGRSSREAQLAGTRSRPAAAASSLRSRWARQSPHCALLRVGHGWVSAWRPPGCACPLLLGSRPDAPERGSRVRRRRPKERPGPSPTAGLPGASSGSPETRRGGPPQPLLPPRGAPVMSAFSHPRPRKRRKAQCTPRVPRSAEPGPASRHFLSENGARRWGRRRRRSGRASSRSESCCLPGRWGGRWSFLWRGGEWPRSGGRLGHAQVHVWTATRSRSRGPTRSPGLCWELCYRLPYTGRLDSVTRDACPYQPPAPQETCEFPAMYAKYCISAIFGEL